MSLSTDALRAAALKVLADDVETAVGRDKDRLKATMAEHGIDRLAAKLPDGTRVASLPLVGDGEDKARVTDPAAFLAWVEKHRPDMIERTVRKAFTKAILDAVDAKGAAVDEASGEVIPGIGFAPTTPYVSVVFAKGKAPGEDGRELIRQAWRSGALDMRELIALPQGDGSDAD